MLKFQLESLSKKEFSKDVLVSLISGSEITLNYFELISDKVTISVHEHPVEHLVILLKGEVEFCIEEERSKIKEGEGLFIQARAKHTARGIRYPVKALEIFEKTEDKYYSHVKQETLNNIT